LWETAEVISIVRIFTAQRYANAALAAVMCLSVGLSDRLSI